MLKAKKCAAAVLAALWLAPAAVMAQLEVTMDRVQAGENSLAVFSLQQAQGEAPGLSAPLDAGESAAPQTTNGGETTAGAEASPTVDASLDASLIRANVLVEERFAQAAARQVYERVSARGMQGIVQEGKLYTDGNVASLARVWRGEQPDGRTGSTAATLALDLSTGEEIAFDRLFDDPEAAVAAMEAIIERDILADMSGYMEYANLLPMPRDCFGFDETGLTVYYQDDAYRHYDGTSGSVTFYWHEITAFIGEDSPVYALAQPAKPDAQAVEAQVKVGKFPGLSAVGLGDALGVALEALNVQDDPDYTANSMLYLFEEPWLRGYALEIPKYADTAQEDTPVSAVRASRVDLFGLVTGQSTRQEIVALLGEPQQTRMYDEDDAFDMMLDTGESLCYELGGRVLEAHLDEGGVLSCLILREAMPETLY